jgi:hypothetical protein
MDQIAEHPFINDLSDRLTELNVDAYFKELRATRSKNYSQIIAEADTFDSSTMIFSTKGKDNWNALFSQLISAQEGEDVDAASLAQSYKTLTMSEKPKIVE